MTREELQAASEALRDAAELVDDATLEERIYDQSSQMADLATADRGPDQGRLDRHMNALRDIREDTSGDADDLVASAFEHVRAYRETVGGV